MTLPPVRRRTLMLALKWSGLASVVSAVIVAVLWVKIGHMPVAETIRTSHSEGTNHPSVGLPIVWTRLFDPIFVMLPAALVAGIGFDKVSIYHWWTRGEGTEESDAHNVFDIGLILGIVGAILTALAGVWVVVIGSVLVVVLALFLGVTCLDDKNHPSPAKPSWSFSIEVVAAAVFWLFSTLFVGTVGALLLTLLGLCVAAAVHFGLYYVIRTGYRFFTGRFSSAMLPGDAD